MRFLLVTALLTLNFSSAWAYTCDNSFPELSSHYTYAEKVLPQYKMDIQKVFHYGGRGEEEVSRLQKKDYNCRRRGSVLTLCRKMTELKKVPEDVQQSLRKKYLNRDVTVSPATQSPENLFCSELAEGWKFYRKVKFGEKTFENYELHSLEQKKILKLYLEDKREQQMFKIQGDKIWLHQEFRNSHDKGWTRFAVWVEWSPET